jgi:hypothetical protein
MIRFAPFVTFALTSLVLAQQPDAPKTAEKAPASQAAPQSGKGAKEHVRALGSEDYALRQESEQALRKLGKEALPALREGVKDGDAEVQWRSRRLLRQIERGEAQELDARGQAQDPAVPPKVGKAQPMAPRTRALPPMQDRFDDLFGDIERDFGVQIPRAQFFQDDFFRDLQQQMDDLRAQMQQHRTGTGPLGQGQSSSQSQSMQMQVGPHGVRVEVKSKNQKGEEETKVYEAPDMDTFQQKYPGVLDGQGMGGGVRMFLGNGQGGMPFAVGPRGMFRGRVLQPMRNPDQDQDQDQGQDADPVPMDAMVPPPEGKRLGVVVRPEISAELRDYLGLEAGTGLQVDEVQPDTLAKALGLERGDIITKIGDTKIGVTADVQQALGGIDAGKRVEVHVLRRGKEQVLSADKPMAKADGTAPKLEKRRKSESNEIR